MRCNEIEVELEGIADGTRELGVDALAHLRACASCAAGLATARAVHDLLVAREVPAPSARFTAGVMARVGRDRWQAERTLDLGFNLAVAVGVLIMVAGGAGLAWSLGFVSVAVDVGALLDVIGSDLGARVRSQVQTLAMALVLLTMTLGLWWWAEADPGP